jgi:hypothetical protein
MGAYSRSTAFEPSTTTAAPGIGDKSVIFPGCPSLKRFEPRMDASRQGLAAEVKADAQSIR